jgi:hypothetical protein
MSTTRRTFIAAAATVAATNAGASLTVNNIPKLVHHVFFWLKNPASKEDLARLLKGLRTLAAIETVRGAHFGVPPAPRSVTWWITVIARQSCSSSTTLPGRRPIRITDPQAVRG